MHSCPKFLRLKRSEKCAVQVSAPQQNEKSLRVPFHVQPALYEKKQQLANTTVSLSIFGQTNIHLYIQMV